MCPFYAGAARSDFQRVKHFTEPFNPHGPRHAMFPKQLQSYANSMKIAPALRTKQAMFRFFPDPCCPSSAWLSFNHPGVPSTVIIIITVIIVIAMIIVTIYTLLLMCSLASFLPFLHNVDIPGTHTLTGKLPSPRAKIHLSISTTVDPFILTVPGQTHTLNPTPKPLFWRRLNVSIDWSRPFGVRPLSRKRLRNLLRFPLRLSISPCTGWCRRNGFPRNGEAQTLPKPYWVLGVQASPQPPARINLCRKITFNCSPNARTAPAPGISFPLGWF